ncbi:hypothetical protein HFN_1910 [Helicobacter fennelliae MRY12-0050]|uniref:Uncharacterized protein n=1 Tax=Helicobacter fennelliae MRY12-0050 TaxID=1325130 RepID=T1DV77_9HELI|nr:hypothetical protein HFN_1910 [Helicobacter fennelliae MRY12-0050]
MKPHKSKINVYYNQKHINFNIFCLLFILCAFDSFATCAHRNT